MYLYTRRFNYVKLRDIYLTETIEAAQDLRSLLDQIEQGLKDNAEYIKKHGNPSIYEATEIAKGQCFKHAFELSIQLHNQMRAAFSLHSPDGTGETDTDIRLVHAVVPDPQMDLDLYMHLLDKAMLYGTVTLVVIHNLQVV